MPNQKKYFGTDGIRGHANRHPMTAQMAQALGAAVVDWMKEHVPHQTRPVVGVGCDTRRSGGMLAAALASGATAMGSDVHLLGILPTPAVAWWTRQHSAGSGSALGVVISASHNPYQDNGIKLFAPDGYKLSDDVEQDIEQRLERWLAGDMTLPEAETIGSISNHPETSKHYLAHLQSLWHSHQDLSKLKVVVDAAHGAAYNIAPQLFRNLGAQVVALGVNPDGININKDCGATHTQTLQQAVLAHQADFGFALDGDADRLIAVDERGQPVDGDQIMAICAPVLQAKRALPHDLVVVTVMSNLGLEHALAEHHIRLQRTDVGDRYVIEQMRQTGASLGGEQSGHLIFAEHSTTGDGLLAALQLMQIAVQQQQPLSVLAGAMKRYPQILKNVVVREKKPWEQIPAIQQEIENVQAQMGSQGRILVRYSGTENRARIMLEGPEPDLLKRWANQIAQQFETHLGG